MVNYFDNLKKLIDNTGNVADRDIEAKKESIQAVKELAESLLGATLCVRGNKFVIRMLEIYYGGIGDDAHDWYRTHFEYKKSKYKEHTDVQNKEGFRVYFNSLDVENTYTRFDIVVGNEGVPVSFLIRGAWDSDFNIIEKNVKKGNPNVVLQKMGLKAEDHNKKIGFNDCNSEIYIENTSDEIKKRKGLKIKNQERINIKSKFEKENGVLWNFYLAL